MKKSPPEFQLLLLSLRLVDQPGAIIEAQRIIEGNQIDWESLYRLADSHSVKPQLALLVRRIGDGLVPAGFRERIESAYHQNLVDQLASVNEFFRVKKKLDEAEVAVIPFKGFWLAHEMYGNLADREAHDIDVFVNFAELEKIKTLMPGTGYQLGAPYRLRINPDDCEYNYGRYLEGRCISHFEFHWRISPAGYGMDISLSNLASQVVTGRLQDQTLNVFTTSANLLLAVMHHGGKDSFVSLKQVYDVARILEKEDDLDWDWLKHVAGKFNVQDLMLIAVRLASSVTGIKVPPEVRSEVERQKIRRLAENRMHYMAVSPARWKEFRFVLNDWLFRIRSRNGFGVKVRLVLVYIRKVIIPALIPKKLHPLFIEKSITPDYLSEA